MAETCCTGTLAEVVLGQSPRRGNSDPFPVGIISGHKLAKVSGNDQALCGRLLPVTVNRTLFEYYRFPPQLLEGVNLTSASPPLGTSAAKPRREFAPSAADISKALGNSSLSSLVAVDGDSIYLPFDFTETVDNLRLERYNLEPNSMERLASGKSVRRLYYLLRGSLPFWVRRRLQKIYLRDWQRLSFPTWPLDVTVDRLHEEILRISMEVAGVEKLPFIWFWPNGARNCLLLTHDIETSKGRDFTFRLMDLDDAYGFKAAYQVIPEQRYDVPHEYVSEIRRRGCEFNIHDLNHDGLLYSNKEEFVRRAAKINRYLQRYASRGFRAGAMYRREDWYDAFQFSYDMSIPNVAHLEPLRGGCCTVMPYFIGDILEIPLTTVQDYSLFHILEDYSLELWKRQIALIQERNGLMSFLTHPDYLIESRARKTYEGLLDHLRMLAVDQYSWVTLPGEVNDWWRARAQMQLVSRNGQWQIEGTQKEKAAIAYVVSKNGRLQYAAANGNPLSPP